MNVLRRAWSRFFNPHVEPDQQLVDALDRVDEAAKNFDEAMERAHGRGIFDPFREAIVKTSTEDGERIRHARRRRRA